MPKAISCSDIITRMKEWELSGVRCNYLMVTDKETTYVYRHIGFWWHYTSCNANGMFVETGPELHDGCLEPDEDDV
jgi:hypothetical protein